MKMEAKNINRVNLSVHYLSDKLKLFFVILINSQFTNFHRRRKTWKIKVLVNREP